MPPPRKYRCVEIFEIVENFEIAVTTSKNPDHLMKTQKNPEKPENYPITNDYNQVTHLSDVEFFGMKNCAIANCDVDDGGPPNQRPTFAPLLTDYPIDLLAAPNVLPRGCDSMFPKNPGENLSKLILPLSDILQQFMAAKINYDLLKLIPPNCDTSNVTQKIPSMNLRKRQREILACKPPWSTCITRH
jgi:hypothetical protein